MGVKLDNVVPFGRSFEEYGNMFDLLPVDFERRILGVGDGPASFNAELHKRGVRVTSVDPIYEFEAEDIRSRFYECVDDIIAQVAATAHDYVWGYHKSPEDLRANRTRALETFVADFPSGREEGRYIPGSLPQLPFDDDQFDLALSGHFLFLYSDHFSLDFHHRSVTEMLRVAREVRIFPLITLMQEPSPHLPALREWLARDGFHTEVRHTHYELQRGGNEMLVITRTR
ncbi:MAG: hypothetical protein AMXMBFR84_28440 [Candidatus Hydrogenedentota bacterium]